MVDTFSRCADPMNRYVSTFTWNDHEQMACNNERNEMSTFSTLQTLRADEHVYQIMTFDGVASAMFVPSHGIDANRSCLVGGRRKSFNHKQLRQALNRRRFKEAAKQYITSTKVTRIRMPFPSCFPLKTPFVFCN